MILVLFIAQFLAYRNLVSTSEKEASTLRAEIERLTVKPYDERHRIVAEQKLAAMTDSGRALLVFLLHWQKTKIDTIQARCQDAEDVFRDGLGRAEKEGLIAREVEPRPGRASVDLYFQISPGFQTVLQDLLADATGAPHFIV